eukprot:gene60053-82151_t
MLITQLQQFIDGERDFADALSTGDFILSVETAVDSAPSHGRCRIRPALADLHSEAFDAPWSASAFADLLGQAGVILEGDNDGFILIRTVADEAEILTLAVRPSARRQGLGARLVRAATDRSVDFGALRMFLEV